MYGWCKLINENVESMTIAYSFGKNEACDGELIYDKNTKEMSISKLSNGASEILTKYFICPLRNRMRKGMELGKRYMVATG